MHMTISNIYKVVLFSASSWRYGTRAVWNAWASSARATTGVRRPRCYVTAWPTRKPSQSCLSTFSTSSWTLRAQKYSFAAILQTARVTIVSMSRISKTLRASAETCYRDRIKSRVRTNLGWWKCSQTWPECSTEKTPREWRYGMTLFGRVKLRKSGRSITNGSAVRRHDHYIPANTFHTIFIIYIYPFLMLLYELFTLKCLFVRYNYVLWYWMWNLFSFLLFSKNVLLKISIDFKMLTLCIWLIELYKHFLYNLFSLSL